MQLNDGIEGFLWAIEQVPVEYTNEHTHDVLRMALFWDRIVKRMQDQVER